MAARVTVVGAGMSGVACARELAAAGVDVRIVERGRAPGGRMASPELHGRRTDLGAAYFTAKDDEFTGLVRDWLHRGLVREWTDTFTVISPDGRSTTSGPMRYATPDGLRSLVRDLLPDSVPVELAAEVGAVETLSGDAIVLAMPDPQARRLLPEADIAWVDYDPVISVAMGFDEARDKAFDKAFDTALDTPGRGDFFAAFVNDDPDVTLIADDGSRRGDGAAVLVAHSTSGLARRHLNDPRAAGDPVVRAVRNALHLAHEPTWIHAQRWTFAKPAAQHDQSFGMVLDDDRPVGVCGDAWCPEGAPRIESAWRSGCDLGRELARQLG